MNRRIIEAILFRVPVGLKSRIKVLVYKALGARLGKRNRFESGRARRCSSIVMGSYNAFTSGYMLWPIEDPKVKAQITIGDRNYFNRNVMIDACGSVEIGNGNMFGPDVYITDSNHTYSRDLPPSEQPMQIGRVKIGNNCWIGAKVTILKDVELGDNCVIAAGAVVTKSFPGGSVVAGIPARVIKIL